MSRKIIIEPDTTKSPLEVMGKYAGECWGSDVSDSRKNLKRGKSCLEDNHGRVLEFVQVYVKIEGFSARFIRELYTHIGGSPTRLQASTRYINYQDGFDYIYPLSVLENNEAIKIYEESMQNIVESMNKLQNLGIPREDVANLLPLGMTSTVVIRTNLRMLMDMSRQRMCTRAYWEFREFMSLLIDKLSNYDDQYEYICSNYFGPKCDFLGYCPENKSCGRWKKESSTRKSPKNR